MRLISKSIQTFPLQKSGKHSKPFFKTQHFKGRTRSVLFVNRFAILKDDKRRVCSTKITCCRYFCDKIDELSKDTFMTFVAGPRRSCIYFIARFSLENAWAHQWNNRPFSHPCKQWHQLEARVDKIQWYIWNCPPKPRPHFFMLAHWSGMLERSIKNKESAKEVETWCSTNNSTKER